jgi:hypothetical protein
MTSDVFLYQGYALLQASLIPKENNMTVLRIETSQGLVIAAREHPSMPSSVVYRDRVYNLWTSTYNETTQEYVSATYRAPKDEGDILLWDNK